MTKAKRMLEMLREARQMIRKTVSEPGTILLKKPPQQVYLKPKTKKAAAPHSVATATA